MAMPMPSSSSPPPPQPPVAGAASEASDAAGTDILLSLLPEILDDILTRLPLKEVVRTCCLSRGWARRWESASGLDVRFRGFYSAGVVSGVLARCAAPVASFDIEVRPRLRPRAAYWLRALAEKRVRSLQLAFGSSRADEPGVFPGVGRAIYACAELSDLYLRYCEVPRPPPPQPGQGTLFAGFPRLTRLALNSVKLPFTGAGALLERVIAGAPDLADLLLVDVTTGVVAGGEKKVEEEREPWVIRAPKLHSLTLWTAVDNGGRVAGELPLLNVANISVDSFLGTEDFLDTLWLVSRVKVLKFSVRDREVNENPLERITWKFRNLRTSTLSVDFGKISSIMSIFSLLRCAPQIEQLHIEVDLKETQGDDEIHEGTLEAYMSDDLVKTLKCVTLAFIKCFPGEMSFIKLLLSKAASLESLKVMMFWHHIMPISDACLLFATYKKASSTQVKFIVEHGMDTFNIVS